MRPKGATSTRPARAADGRAWGWTASAAWRPFGTMGAAVAGAGLAVLAILTFNATREATTAGSAPFAAPAHSAATATRAAPPPKAAFTRLEEEYIRALWPIHGDVERNALRVSLGNILYKTDEIDKADLKRRVDTALAAYRLARARIAVLQPPASLAREHDDYLAAIRLFERSALEEMKVFDDGDDAHLLAAHPLSREGGDKIREIGVRFWKDEFPAH